MVRIIKKACYFFAVLFICLAAGEAMLIIMGYGYSPLKLKEPASFARKLGKEDSRLPQITTDKYCIYDPQLIWRPRNGYGIFNAQGFRGRELNYQKQQGEYRVFVIGDSNSAGPRDKPGWPEYLQELFLENGSSVLIINASCWGYSSYQGLKRFEEILKYEPDMVLISFGANDAHRGRISDREYIEMAGSSYLKTSRFRLAQLVAALSESMLMLAKKDRGLKPRVGLGEYEDNLKEIVRIAGLKNIRVIFLTRPYIGASHHPLWWKNFAPQYYELTKRIAAQSSCELIDLFAEFKDKKIYFKDESHFNDEGFRLAAKMLYAHLTGPRIDLVNNKEKL